MRNFGTYFTGTYGFLLVPCKRACCTIPLGIHLLRVGWRNLFSSCQFFGSGGKQVLVLHTTYVIRVPYNCGVVLVFLVVAGNSFWCYVRTQCTIQLCGGKVNFVQIFLLNPNFLLVHRRFSKNQDFLQPYSRNCFAKISRTSNSSRKL